MLRTVPSRSIAKNMIARSARYTTDPWARPRRTKEHHRSLRSLHYKLWSDLHWSWSDLLFSFIFLSQITYFWSLPFPFYFFGQYLWSIYNYWSLRSLQILIDGRGRATPNNTIEHDSFSHDPWLNPQGTPHHTVRSHRSWSHLFIFWSFIIFSFSFTILSKILITPYFSFIIILQITFIITDHWSMIFITN